MSNRSPDGNHFKNCHARIDLQTVFSITHSDHSNPDTGASSIMALEMHISDIDF
jgi:hypothetical protein